MQNSMIEISESPVIDTKQILELTKNGTQTRMCIFQGSYTIVLSPCKSGKNGFPIEVTCKGVIGGGASFSILESGDIQSMPEGWSKEKIERLLSQCMKQQY